MMLCTETVRHAVTLWRKQRAGVAATETYGPGILKTFPGKAIPA